MYTRQYSGLRPPILRTHFRWSGNRILLFSLLLSLLVHICFLLFSRSWNVSDIRKIEREVGTLFKVNIQKLESRNFVSRPTQQQLLEERERVLRNEIAMMSERTAGSAETEIETMLPDMQAEDLPQWEGREDEEENYFANDVSARSLIQSDIGSRSVRDFEQTSGEDIVTDNVQTKRIPLTGRGAGSARRIMSDLPSPVLRPDPVVSRSITMVLNKEVSLPAPELDVSEPPIDLPPITELLPSLDLMRSRPAPAKLKNEEKALDEIKDRYIRLDDLVQVDLFTYHHIGGEGYFMIRIRPKTADDRLRILPKDVLMVLDASGSMGRRRIDVIKKELRGILERLRPEDRFMVIGFKQSVRHFPSDYGTFVSPDADVLKAAWQFINPLEASGRTDIYSSLQPLVQLGTERARPLILLLVSDGRPTFGVRNSRKIINNLTRFRSPSTSIYCIGTGNELNQYLLDMLAFMNRGRVAFERDRADLPAVMQSVYGYVEDPVLLRVSADFGSVEAAEIYPKTLPDLNLKGEIRAWGRLRNEKKITLRLVGEAFDESKETIVELPVPEFDNGTYEIAQLWASSKIYHLIGQMVEKGESPEILEQIQNLSRTYRVVTPYSSEILIR